MCSHTTIHEMQSLCRAAMAHLTARLRPGMHLTEVRRIAEDYLLAGGADSFWYHGVGAFVFSGTDTAVSVSGRTYRTPDAVLGETDILTVDLSPQRGGVWGDYARTILLQNGQVISEADAVENGEWRAGLKTELALHDALRECAAPQTTFAELHRRMNDRITAAGYENVDFLGNLGHSIARDPAQRIYIEPGNTAPLSAVPAFTFEPHIRRPGSPYGFKMENIYRFAGGSLTAE